MIVKLQDDNEVEIKIYNARNITLNVSSKLVKLVEQEETITELVFSDGFHIAIGDLFPLISECDTKTAYNIVNILNITPKTNGGSLLFLISCTTISKSTHWLLPFVGKTKHQLGLDTVLRNVYCYNDIEEYSFYKEGYLFAVYNYLKEYDYFLDSLKELPNCSQVYKLHSRFEYLAVFKIPEHYRRATELILEGKYSEIPELAKNQILRFHGLEKGGNTHKILYRDKGYMEELKKDLNITFDLNELEGIFNIESETLK